MLKDVQNSIKAKLYDFTYSPFMSSMIISWIIINHKYILIYLASYDLDKKLSLLNQHDFTFHTSWFNIPWAFNIWLPILFGLFYTFIYPVASKKFYEFTLEKNKELKKIKQDIEDITPITQEEARALRESITQLTENKYALEKKLIEVEERYKKKTQELNSKMIVPPTGNVPKIDKEVTNHQKIVKLEEDDRTKILRFLYESNYKYAEEDELLDVIFKSLKVARPKAKLIIGKLLKENILNLDNYNQVIITDNGNNKLIEMFDKE